MLNQKIIISILSLFLLASCETATQNALKGSAGNAGKASKASKASTGSSIFGSAKQTQADKLIAVGDRVLFDYDSSELSSEAKLTLDKQSRFLRANTDLNFIIEGHCDERGTREYNLALGERRANAVKDYLMTYGISGKRMSVISYGKERPVNTESTPLAWSQNRRSVTVKVK